MTLQARRYNEGKLRYGLISDIGLRELARVYTRGAEKYTLRNEDGSIKDDGANNWRKGLPISNLIDSTLRHIQAFKEGEDIDPDLGTYHVANAAWNLFTILDQYKNHPELDDRRLKSVKRIGLDIDGVLADFIGELCKKFGKPGYEDHNWWDPFIVESFNKVKKDEEFWASLPPLIEAKDLPFEPVCYITARPIGNEVSKAWLDKNSFPVAPVYTVTGSKLDLIKENKLDVFVDDKYEAFVEFQKNGVVCYLMDQPWNRKYNVGHWRIKSLAEIA